MTQPEPQPNLRTSKRQQAAAKKPAKANVTPIAEKAAQKAAAKAAHPATGSKQPAKKAPAKKAAAGKLQRPAELDWTAEGMQAAGYRVPATAQRELSRVGPLPTPNALDWTEKDGVHLATSGRWRYRVQETEKGWFASQASGSWTPLHNDPQDLDAAKRICEIVDAGAHWIGWAKYRSMSWAEIEKAAKGE